MMIKARGISVGVPVLLMALFGLASGALAQQESGPEAEGLVEYEKARVDVAYIRPGTDWSKYKTIYFSPLRVTPEAQDATPERRSDRGRAGESYVLRDKDVQTLVEIYADAMRSEMGKRGGLVVVEEPQADSLILVAGITDIYLSLPIESTRRISGFRSGIYDERGGALTIAAVLADGETGLVIARAFDTRYPAGGMWDENTRMRNISDARRIFRAWIRNFRNRVVDFQSGKVPAP